jgi:hypothetical protein
VSASYWKVGAWYSHDMYPKRRIQVVTVDSDHARGIMYRNGSAVQHVIRLDYIDIKHCFRLEDRK